MPYNYQQMSKIILPPSWISSSVCISITFIIIALDIFLFPSCEVLEFSTLPFLRSLGFPLPFIRRSQVFSAHLLEFIKCCQVLVWSPTPPLRDITLLQLACEGRPPVIGLVARHFFRWSPYSLIVIYKYQQMSKIILPSSWISSSAYVNIKR